MDTYAECPAESIAEAVAMAAWNPSCKDKIRFRNREYYRKKRAGNTLYNKKRREAYADNKPPSAKESMTKNIKKRIRDANYNVRRRLRYAEKMKLKSVVPKRGRPTHFQPLPGIVERDRNGNCRCSCFSVPRQAIATLQRLVQETMSEADWGSVSRTGGSLQHVPPDGTGMAWLRRKIEARRNITSGRKEELIKTLEAAEVSILNAVRSGLGIIDGASQDFEVYLGFLRSLEQAPQDAHVDFPHETSTRDGNEVRRLCTECKRRKCTCTAIRFLPVSVVIPLTIAGSKLEVWEDANYNMCQQAGKVIMGTIVTVPFGYGFSFRGGTVHAGVFKTPGAHMNERLHLYVYPRTGGLAHSGNYSNQAKSENGRSLSKVFVSSAEG